MFEGVCEERVGVGRFFSEESVAQDEGENVLHVVGMDFAPTVEEGCGLGGTLEGQSGPGGDGVILPEGGADGLAKG